MWTMFSVRSCSPEEMKIFVPLMAYTVGVGLGAGYLAEIGAALRLGEHMVPPSGLR